MFPRAAVYDVLYGRQGDAVLGSYCRLWKISKTLTPLAQGANGQHVFLGNLRSYVATTVRRSALRCLVFVVVVQRSEEQVRRVATRWIVASVQDVQAVWNRAVGALVGDTMRSKLRSLFVADDAVSGVVDGSLPRPAIVRRSGLVIAEEPFGHRDQTRAVRAGSRTELASQLFDGARAALLAHRSRQSWASDRLGHALSIAHMGFAL